MRHPARSAIVATIISLQLLVIPGCLDPSKLTGPPVAAPDFGTPFQTDATLPAVDVPLPHEPDAGMVADTSPSPVDASGPDSQLAPDMTVDASGPDSQPAPDMTVDTGPNHGTPSGTLLFVGDFESGDLDLSKWHFSGNDTTTTVTSPVRSGQRAARMVVGPQDDIPYRSELVIRQGGGDFHDGHEYWIGLSFRIADWGDPLPRWSTLFQTHARPHELPDGSLDWSCGAGKNSITVTTSDDRIGLNVVVNPDQSKLPGTAAIATRVWSEPFQLGVWYDWVFRYRPSTGADGIIEAWLDGKAIYSQKGANRFRLDQCGEPAYPSTYAKFGIYRDKQNTSTQTLYYDEVRVFEGSNGYAAVVPR